MDKDFIAAMVKEGSTKAGVAQVQALAKHEMDNAGYGPTLHNACAATLSEFMITSSINVPVTLGAGKLARRIEERGWQRVNVGQQQSGDVAVAKNDVHIFLVVQAVGNDDLMVADNQAPGPHPRKASGDPALNHSPVAYFLRSQGAIAPSVDLSHREIETAPLNTDEFPKGDEATEDLKEPFADNGAPNE